jgi:hypothetical protein
MRCFAFVLLAGLIAAPALAQQSPSYKLEEFALNAGGHPQDGAILASASFHVRLDAVGDAVARSGLSGPSFRVDGGFVGAYPPPGEVLGLRFVDSATLMWRPERSVGVYNLYRDLLSALSGGSYGTCRQYDLAAETTIETGAPPAGNGWFYLVTAENRLREEGTKGTNSSGAERPNVHPCP